MTTLAQYHHLSALSLRDQPSEAQALLLRAALFQGDPALAAWHSWRITADLDRLPLGGFGLLPLLADNLQRLGVQDPILDKCHGIHRHTWTQNQLYCRQLAGVLQDLQKNNCSRRCCMNRVSRTGYRYSVKLKYHLKPDAYAVPSPQLV